MRPTMERIIIDREDYYGKETIERHKSRYNWATSFLRCSDKVLDLCCGTGYGSKILSTKALSVTGIDKSLSAVISAASSYGSKRLSFLNGSLPSELKNIPSNSFDVVVCIEGIEHIKDVKTLLVEIKRILIPRGVLILTAPKQKGKVTNKYHLREYTKDQFEKLFDGYTFEYSYMPEHLSYCGTGVKNDNK